MILYIETNFIVGGARGQSEAFLQELLDFSTGDLRIALPASCVVEALYSIGAIHRQHDEFTAKLESELEQLRRDAGDPVANDAYARLQQGSIAFAKVFNRIQNRGMDIIRYLVGSMEQPGRCELLPFHADSLHFALPHADAVEQIMDRPVLKRDDWLIAATLLEHASKHPDEMKGFLSANYRDFGHIIQDFHRAKVVYFTSAQSALGWVRANLPASI